jgi:hypothetical protein
MLEEGKDILENYKNEQQQVFPKFQYFNVPS